MNKPDREQEAKRKTEQGVRWGPKLREQSVGKKACLNLFGVYALSKKSSY